MIEEWRDVKGYERCYQISSLGRVKSVERIVIRNNIEIRVKERILKPVKDKDGYVQARLYKNGIVKTIAIHRLVAIAFIDREDETFEVNHKDENKSNNTLDNLEWMSRIDNLRYGTGIARCAISRRKPVIQMDLNGNAIKVWKSSREIERTIGFSNTNICKVCLGKQKTAYGFRWKHAQ